MKLLFALLLLSPRAFAFDYPEDVPCAGEVDEASLEVPPPKGSIAERIHQMFARAASFSKAHRVRTEMEKILVLFDLLEQIGEGRQNDTIRSIAIESKMVTAEQVRELEKLASPLRLTPSQVETLARLCEKDHYLYSLAATLLLTGANPNEETVALLRLALQKASPELGKEYDRMPRFAEFIRFSSSIGALVEDNRRILRLRRGPTGDQTLEDEEADWELEVDRRFDRALKRKPKE